MWWYGNGLNGWGYALMTISMVVFWALIIYGVVLFARYLGRSNRPRDQRPAPEDLLAERFARGEIDEQEYRQRLEALRQHRTPVPKP